MTFFYFVVITHFYRVFTYSAQGGANYISQTAFLPNFLPDYLFYSSLFQFHPLQSFFLRPRGQTLLPKRMGAWPDKPPWIRHYILLYLGTNRAIPEADRRVHRTSSVRSDRRYSSPCPTLRA